MSVRDPIETPKTSLPEHPSRVGYSPVTPRLLVLKDVVLPTVGGSRTGGGVVGPGEGHSWGPSTSSGRHDPPRTDEEDRYFLPVDLKVLAKLGTSSTITSLHTTLRKTIKKFNFNDKDIQFYRLTIVKVYEVRPISRDRERTEREVGDYRSGKTDVR